MGLDAYPGAYPVACVFSIPMVLRIRSERNALHPPYENTHEMALAGIRRVRHQDLIARIDRHARGDQGRAYGAGGDHDEAGGKRRSVARALVLPDGIP